MRKAKTEQEPAKPKRGPGRPRKSEEEKAPKIYRAKPDDSFYRADDVKDMLGVSQSSAFRIIQALRGDLIKEGVLSERYPRGRIPKAEFNKRMGQENA